ncbi:MAG: hypothetical protein ACRC36_20530 [Lacrimispora sphenoides]
MNKKNQPRPSEVIKDFLDYLVNSQKEYQAACTEMFAEDKKVQDFLHAIEFEKDSKVRSKISTQFHISRNCRRTAKVRYHLNLSELQNSIQISPISHSLINCAAWSKIRRKKRNGLKVSVFIIPGEVILIADFGRHQTAREKT